MLTMALLWDPTLARYHPAILVDTRAENMESALED